MDDYGVVDPLQTVPLAGVRVRQLVKNLGDEREAYPHPVDVEVFFVEGDGDGRRNLQHLLPPRRIVARVSGIPGVLVAYQPAGVVGYLFGGLHFDAMIGVRIVYLFALLHVVPPVHRL